MVGDGNVTIATMSMHGITVTGSAKREPGDKPDKQIGADLAVARAMHKMSRRLMRRANGAVKQASFVKADRARRRAQEEQPTGRANVRLPGTGRHERKKRA